MLSSRDKIEDGSFRDALARFWQADMPLGCSGKAGGTNGADLPSASAGSFDVHGLHTGPIDIREVRLRPGFHTYIVLDTNILMKDWFLRGAGFSALGEVRSSINAQLVVPEVVLDELLANYREGARKAVAAIAQLSRYPLDVDKESEAMVSAYREFFDQQQQKGTVIAVPYPQVSHGEVVQRIYEKRRPFHRGESGYKDFLIWRSIVELIEREEDWDFTRAVFISANSRDFAESKPSDSLRLHEDYLVDLAQNDGDQARVVYFPSDRFV